MINLEYLGKLPESAYFEQRALKFDDCVNNNEQSMLLHGNNADVMRSLLKHHGFAKSIDLVYIDPPFSTNTVFRIGSERTATISHEKGDKVAYSDVIQGEGFLEFIRERLILLRELMSDRGSIYFHIDYKVGHYIKIIMDEVFGAENFRSDISRIKCNPKNFSRKGYGNIKDLILFYSKSSNYIWHEPRVGLSENDLERLYKKVDKQGRRYTTVPVHAPGETMSGATSQPWRGVFPPKGRHWRCDPKELDTLDAEGKIEWSKTRNPRRIIFASEAAEKGKKLQDIWEFKDKPYPEYPTQKNISLLELIVQASSDPRSIVLDCFCGSGTTLLAAEKLGRRWIGIDQSDPAIEVAKRRLVNLGLFSSGFIEEKYPTCEMNATKYPFAVSMAD